MATMASKRPTYSLPAIQKYLKHISLPHHHTTSLLQSLSLSNTKSQKEWAESSEGLSALSTLQKYQQAKIPFSNLYLHYSHHHKGTLDPVGLYEYIINSSGIATEGSFPHTSEILSQGTLPLIREKELFACNNDTERKWIEANKLPSGGRGGTCTMNNNFFGTIMRSLGMGVKTAGARVALSVSGGPRGRFAGWNHLVNLVSFEGKKYLVDVGFGGNGPTAPILLEDGFESAWGVTEDRVRLIWKEIDDFESPEEKVWVLQHRRGRDGEWEDIYCFLENEFTGSDIGVMNFKSAGDVRGSFFNHMVICVRTLMDGEDVVGTITLVDGKVKRVVRGVSETVGRCGSEVDRWEALEERFGIVLGEEERLGIKGLVTELRGGGLGDD